MAADPPPIQGRWMLYVCPECSRWWGGTYSSLSDPSGLRLEPQRCEGFSGARKHPVADCALVEVVPVPDEAAIERAAKAMYERGYPLGLRESWKDFSARQPTIAARFRESVEAIVRAALEDGDGS